MTHARSQNERTFNDSTNLSFALESKLLGPFPSVLLRLPPLATDATVETVDDTVDTVLVTVDVTFAAARRTSSPPYPILSIKKP